MSGTDETDIESLIDAARLSGAVDPEPEITALQDLLRVAWSLMSETQQAALIESDEAQALLAEGEDAPEEGEEEL
jgi:hypothetical protein